MDSIVLIAVDSPNDDCEGCVFDTSEHCLIPDDLLRKGSCNPLFRDDGRSIVWRLKHEYS